MTSPCHKWSVVSVQYLIYHNRNVISRSTRHLPHYNARKIDEGVEITPLILFHPPMQASTSPSRLRRPRPRRTTTSTTTPTLTRTTTTSSGCSTRRRDETARGLPRALLPLLFNLTQIVFFSKCKWSGSGAPRLRKSFLGYFCPPLSHF